MAATTCPIGDCTYSGPAKSVEAHISGSASGDHAGKLGRQFREKIIEQIEREANGDGRGLALGLSAKEWAIVFGVAVVLFLFLRSATREEEREETPDDGEEEEELEALLEGGGEL